MLTATMNDAPPTAAKATPAWGTLPHEIIDGGEIVLLAIKPSMWRPLFDSLPWVVVCGALAVFMVTVRTTLPGLSVAVSAQVVVLIAAVRLAVAIVHWVPTWYVLTNRRILNVHGVRTPRYVTCRLADIRNTHVNISPTEKMTHTGSILFVTCDSDKVAYIWRSIPQPDAAHQRIRRAIEDALDQHSL